MYFPGGYFPGQDPFDERLAWVTLRALEQTGAEVVPVRYASFVDPDQFDAGVRRDVSGALAYYKPARVTFVGKSRGTHALALLCREQLVLPGATRLIWLTPAWKWDSSWQAACDNRIPSLHVVGLADHDYHLPERHAAVFGETVAIPAADHRLEVDGDIHATLDAWRTMADAIVEFVQRPTVEDAGEP